VAGKVNAHSWPKSNDRFDNGKPLNISVAYTDNCKQINTNSGLFGFSLSMDSLLKQVEKGESLMIYAVILLIILFAPTPAFAYFDPGTGSLLIQALVGSVAFMAMFWRQGKAYITRIFSANTPNPSSGERNTANDGHRDTETQDENRP